MKPLEPSASLAAGLWWAWFWRTFVMSLLIVLMIMFFFLRAARALELDGGAALINSLYVGVFVSIILSLRIIGRMMTKGFSDLLLMSVRKRDLSPLEPGEITVLQTWWAMTWRTGLLVFWAAICVAIFSTFLGALTDMGLIPLRLLQFPLTLCASFPVGVFVLSRMLQKGFGDHKLVVVNRFEK